jgi:hypothetical protein
MSGKKSILYALLLAVCSGCADPSQRTYPVTGTVTFAGKAVESGMITFDPADGSAGSIQVMIEDGRYQLLTKAGSKKVSIMAFRDVPEKAVGGRPPRECYIPSRYNTATTLTTEVKVNDTNQIDFHLPAD